LTLLGDGPKSPPTGPTIRPLRGHHPPDKVAAAMARAQALVAPSLCYESFGMVVVEAFAAGLPVIASRLGALAELVREGETGLLFTPGDPQDLAAKIRWAEAHPDAMARMGEKARQVYGDHYTAAANLPQLEAVYAQALSSRWPQGRVSPDAD
jgi:glycosyltransferase involved in cell wall biosynthesis